MDLVDKSIILMTYHAFFRSVMCYGIILWGGSPHASKILKLQKRAIRTITNSKYNDTCRPLFKNLGILTATNQFIFECIVYAHNHLSEYETQTNYNTRHRPIIAPHFRLSKNINSYRYLPIKLYNMLPNEWKHVNTKKFIIKIKSFLREMVFYEVQEFIEYFKPKSV